MSRGRRRAAVERLGARVERLGGVGARRGGAVRGPVVVRRERGLVQVIQVARGGSARRGPAAAPLARQPRQRAAAQPAHPAHPVRVPARQHERRAQRPRRVQRRHLRYSTA